ncbi:MAG: DnaJ domain-containing protein [Leptospira sp.]|nr:DnaJ domain-containing protein [Leptospira sp.]
MNFAVGKRPNYYEILGVDRDSTQDLINERYKYLCEHNEMLSRMDPWLRIEESIVEQSRAYKVLGDPRSRKNYDKKIDFDIVVLDKEIDKTDLAEVSLNYKRYCAAHYEDLVNKFNTFKKEMNESLWLIKTTSIFLIFDVISSVIFTFMFYEYTRMNYNNFYNIMKPWAFTVFVFFVYIQFLIFRYSWQLKRMKVLFKDY